jgi:uncharacterized membrane protein YgcG
MGSLTTDVKDSKPEVVNIFKTVLLCSEMEAQFFLESADWDIASVSTFDALINTDIIPIWLYCLTRYVCVLLPS